jgi:hypothetical protein
MPGNIITHELADDLCCGLVLRPADFKETIAQIALHSDAKARIFCHGRSVTNGYTFV